MAPGGILWSDADEARLGAAVAEYFIKSLKVDSLTPAYNITNLQYKQAFQSVKVLANSISKRSL